MSSEIDPAEIELIRKVLIKVRDANLSKNLRASLFNDDLSNEPNFGRIHLAGQYL